MKSNFQEGQKVITPDGEGSVVYILADEVTVILSNGEEKKFLDHELMDDSDPG